MSDEEPPADGPDEGEDDAWSAAPDAEETPPGRLFDDPFHRAEADPETGAEASGDSSAVGADPFASLSDVSGEGDPFEAFEDVDVGSVDPDAVWEELTGAGAAAAADAAERDVVEVSKHRFCERCEHFSAPPEVSCSAEGAEIAAFVDMETVRVVDCPVVAERRAFRDDLE